MEPLTEKHRSLKSSFSDSDSEDDIVVYGGDGPSNEDRQLLNEEEEREKLLTKRRKILIGSKKDRGRRSSSRRKSIESYMEDGTLDTPRRSKSTVPHPSEMSGLIGLETTMFYQTTSMLPCPCVQYYSVGDYNHITCARFVETGEAETGV